MSDTIVRLRVLPPPAEEPLNANSIEMLGWLYREAVAGRVHAVGLVCIRTDEDGDLSDREWFDAQSASHAAHLIGLMQCLSQTIARHRDE